MSAVLQEMPLPARLVPWHPALHTTLARCLLLALLLHLWAVLMFGSAPGGTARPGEGVGGRLNITLRGPVSEGASEMPPAPPAQPAPGAAAQSAVPRWGGSVRQRETPPESLPGAAQLGVPAAPPPLPAPEATVRTSPVAPPPEPGRVLQERAADTVPPPAPTPVPEPAPEPVPAEGRLQAPAAAAPVNNLRLAPQPALPQLAPLPLPEGPTATVAQPAPARELVSPVLQGPQVAPVPAPALPRTTAVPIAAPERVTLPAPSAVPDTLPAAPQAPQAPSPAASPMAPATPEPEGGPADAGSRVGHDVATPGAAAASAPKKLNLELNRPRGGELSRWGSMGALPVLPRLPERDEKLAREIEKAGRADCAKAYREAGIGAVLPLVADALKKDGGCKW